MPDTEAAREQLAQGARRRDYRSAAQRNHDARSVARLCDGPRWLPKRIPGQLVITASLADIKAGCGSALTATGAIVLVGELPLRQRTWIRRWWYSAIIRGEVLSGPRQSATLGQRLALFARDRGCTAPDCDHAFHPSEAHHLPGLGQGWRHRQPMC